LQLYKSAETYWERAGLLWGAVHTVLFRQIASTGNNIRVVRYEDICDSPVEQFADLFRYFDIGLDHRVRQFINVTGNPDTPRKQTPDTYFKIAKDTASQSHSWRDKVDGDDYRECARYAGSFNLPVYRDLLTDSQATRKTGMYLLHLRTVTTASCRAQKIPAIDARQRSCLFRGTRTPIETIIPAMIMAAVILYWAGTIHGMMARAIMNSRNCSCTTWPDRRAAFLHILHVAGRPCHTVALVISLSAKEMPGRPQCGHMNMVKQHLPRERPDYTQYTNGQFPRSAPDLTKHINRPVA